MGETDRERGKVVWRLPGEDQGGGQGAADRGRLLEGSNRMSFIDTMPKGGGIDYSLEEQDTGLKWIDGKKIYQKTVDCGTGPSAKSIKSVPHNISGISTIVSMDGFGFNGSIYWPLPYLWATVESRGGLYMDENNVYIDALDDQAKCHYYITIRYTKTT